MEKQDEKIEPSREPWSKPEIVDIDGEIESSFGPDNDGVESITS